MTNFSELFRKYNPMTGLPKTNVPEPKDMPLEQQRAYTKGLMKGRKLERNRILNEVLKLDFDSFDDIVLKKDVLLAIRGPRESQ